MKSPMIWQFPQERHPQDIPLVFIGLPLFICAN
jgi:hypothetical protein